MTEINSGKIFKAHFILTEQDVEKLKTHLWARFENVSLYNRENDQNTYHVEIIYEGPVNKSVIEGQILEICQIVECQKPVVNFSEVSNMNWLQHVYQSFDPIQAGRFCIYDHNDKKPHHQDGIMISIDASTAFGSGEHGTTKGCLLALDDLLNQEKKSNFQKVLDMGCGSGVLAIAMAKTIQGQIYGVDHDVEAIRVAGQNCYNNRVSNNVSLESANGFQAKIVRENQPFDLIMANILYQPLVDMVVDMKRSIHQNGLLILSGILQTQADHMIQTYQKHGFNLLKKYPIDEWQTVLLRKN